MVAEGAAGLEAHLAARHQIGDGLLAELHLVVGDHGGVVHEQKALRWLDGLSDEEGAALAVVMAEELAGGDDGFCTAAYGVGWMEAQPPALTADDTRLLLGFQQLPHRGYDARRRNVDLLLMAVRRLLDTGAPEAAEVARQVGETMAAWNTEPGGSGAEGMRLRAMLLGGLLPAPRPAALGPLSLADGFGVAAATLLGTDEAGWPPGVAELLGHAGRATASRPSARWTRQCEQLVEQAEHAEGIIAALLVVVEDTAPLEFVTTYGTHARLVTANDDLVRGLVWTTGVMRPAWLVERLEAVAARCIRESKGRNLDFTPVRGEKVQYACFTTLASSGRREAAAALGRLATATSNRTSRRRLDAELSRLAETLGTTTADLVETSKPDWGLGPDGTTTVAVGSASAQVRLDDLKGAVLTWAGDGGTPDEHREVITRRHAELRRASQAERGRLEELLTSDRSWLLDDFHTRLIGDPVSAFYARRLVWLVSSPDGSAVVGLPTADADRWRTTSGTVTVEAPATVRIWHPAAADETQIGAVRGLVAEEQVVQPFRQVWRERYHLEALELEGPLYTSRAAGHIVRAPQIYALAKKRGWWGGFLSGWWDQGDRDHARRDYPHAGLQAQWTLAAFEITEDRDVAAAVTDRLTFVLLGQDDPAPVPLTQVPPVVLSETLRDLDLFVSAATVANDPLWLEKVLPRSNALSDYWEALAHGSLATTVGHRRDALAATMPDLPHAGQLELAGDQLIVRGVLRTYAIDLATANTQVRPPGRWLSFPSDWPRPPRPLLAAVDDDVALGRILARARVLAADHRITNPTMKDQLRDL